MNKRLSTLCVTAASAILLVADPACGHANDLDSHNFDTSINPCADFYRYANGGWIDKHPVPDSYTHWSVDSEIAERNLQILKRLLENAAAKPGPAGSDRQKIGDFYTAAMDTQAIDQAGLRPLKPDLAAIAALRTRTDLANLIIDWQARGRQVLFDFAVRPDFHNAGMNIAYAGQAGLGLPDRDDYLRADGATQLLRVSYRKHVARMLDLLGENDAKRESAWVLELETRLARASLSRNDLRDPTRSYHPVSIAEADRITPHFSWQRFFDRIGRSDVARFSLAQPAFFAAADRELATTPISHWRAWLRWRLIDADARYLSRKFVRADFELRGRILHGARQNLPRWKRAIRIENAAIGELLGKVYVAKVFSPRARHRAQALVDNLKRAMRKRIASSQWMSNSGKRDALAKLDAMSIDVGYPHKWRDYSGLQISRDSLLGNLRAVAAFKARREFTRIGRPVDRDAWHILPQTVNAYNDPLTNRIVVPAAQWMPPYFDANADDALNYGAIGALIGHEMTHAFDEQGSHFDALGARRDWWTSADKTRFDSRAKRLVVQYNAFVPIDDLHVDGTRTLGENLADLGGVSIAHDAFKFTAQGKGDSAIDGESPVQRFFLAYARSWRSVRRPTSLRQLLRTAVHAPAKYRVNGPLSNIPAFAHAFSCKPDDPMNRAADARAQLW